MAPRQSGKAAMWRLRRSKPGARLKNKRMLASFCRETRNPWTEADSAARSRIGMISLRPVFAGKRALGHVFSGLKPFATPAAGGAGAATEPCPRRPIDPSKFLIADNSALAVAARGD